MFKKITLLLAFGVSLAYLAAAQDKRAGIIYFDQEIQIRAMMGGGPGGGNTVAFGGGQAPAMPDKVTNRFEMLFSPAGAKFQRSLAEDGAASTGFRISINTRDLLFNGDKVIESFELDGQPFLLENKLGASSATLEKVAGETKIIVGLTCKKAVYTTPENAKITVWYTEDLDFKASPQVQFWPAGVVLGIENDRMNIFATKIDYTKVKDSEFALPKKARLLTQDEYRQKMDEFRAKMGSGVQTMPGGGTRVFRSGPGNE